MSRLRASPPPGHRAARRRRRSRTLLDLGERFLEIDERPIKKVPTLRGKTVINLFLEPSTRTRTSFEIAAKRLSADAVNISGSASSTVKGETLLDTARNLDAMAPDVVVVRHAQAGAAEMLASRLRGGGGQRRRRRARAPDPGAARLLDHPRAQGAHRRAARSSSAATSATAASRARTSGRFTKLGARVRLVAPRTLLAPGLEAMGAPAASSIARAAGAGAGGGRRRHDAADPEGAHRRARCSPTRASTRATSASTPPPGAGQARRHRHAPRADQPRHRDRSRPSPTARAPSSSTRSPAASRSAWPCSTCSPAATPAASG